MMTLRSQVVGCGAYLPERIVTNDELAARLDTSDEWIRQRTGIGERHIAAAGELTSDLAVRRGASGRSSSAGMSGSDLDLIVLATATPDHTFPATATKVQARLGMKRGAAFDVQAVCSGFIFALAVADNALRLGQARTALVIGAETFSRILDWEDRGTCVLFGDGAGAVVLKAVPEPGAGGRGVLSTHLHSDGRQHDILYVDGGPSSTGTAGLLRMEGREVFRQAVQHLSEVVDEALAANGLDRRRYRLAGAASGQHAASSTRSGASSACRRSKVVVTIERHANTSAASIPLALDEAVGRRPDQARPSGADGSAGRRADLGRQPRALVATATSHGRGQRFGI